ncbi:MAG: lytic murein transglycosylase, partial [Patescibacteria group bacterium]
QQDEFIAITKKLGLDPDKMPVSATPSYGWGGAMGPAQFLPATWLMYESQIAFHSGHSPPNPWNNTDAFFASALYLRDLGASAQNETAEWTAAMKYLAGSNWKKPSLRFYGDHVMEIASRIQEDIRTMEGK